MRSLLNGAVGTLLAVGLLGACAPPDDLTVFAAASLSEAFGELADVFAAEHPGTDVTVSFGGSASLATQIAEGAPVDVFASADAVSMDGLGDLVTDPVVFARNRLTLIVPPGNPGGVGGVADLGDPGVRLVVCAVEVPCGRLAAEALGDVEAAPVSFEENVKAVVTKVILGEADAGLVYVSDAVAAGGGAEAIAIPGAPTTEYPAATVAGSPHEEAAQAFIELLVSPTGAEILARHGFEAP